MISAYEQRILDLENKVRELDQVPKRPPSVRQNDTAVTPFVPLSARWPPRGT
jgi:hypothetical protein